MTNGNRVLRSRILQWNVRPLRRRHAELAILLLRLEYDILLLQETCTRAGTLELTAFIAYHGSTKCELATCCAVRCSVASHPSGQARASLYVRADLPHSMVDIEGILSDGVEAVALMVRMGSPDTSVASIYIRTEQFHARWDTDFVCRLTNSLRRDAVIGGDFNSHHSSWGCTLTDQRGRDLAAIHRAGLVMLNTGQAT